MASLYSILGIGALFAAIVFFSAFVYVYIHRVKNIPYQSGPGLVTSLINLPNFHTVILKLAKQHNGLFQSRVLFSNLVYVMKPDLAKEALTKITNKGWMYSILAFIPGCMSIFEADTKEWEAHNKCFKGSFSMNSINNNASGIIHQLIDKFGTNLSDKIKQSSGKAAEIQVDTLFSALTVDVISKAGFDFDMGALDGSAEYDGMMLMSREYMTGLRCLFGNPFFPLFFWTKELIQFNKSFKHLKLLFEKILDHALEKYGDVDESTDDKTVASGLVKLSKQPGITRDHLICDVRTFFLAGHDTTAHSLSFICYLLAANPRVQKLGQEAVDDFLKENPNHSANMCHDYVDAIIKEGVRMLPVTPAGSVRRVTDPKGVTIGQYHLPCGTWIQTPFYVLQNWDKIWGDDAGEFRPERWLNDGNHPNISPQGLGGYSGVHMGDNVNDLCFAPFSLGLRKCIGMNLAIMELKAVVTRILSQFTLELPDELKGVPYEDMAVYDFTLRPKDNLKIIVRLRN